MNSRKSNLTGRVKQKGAVAVEYMILVVFIGLIVAAGSYSLGSLLSQKFGQVGQTLYQAQVVDLPNTDQPASGI